MPCEDWRLGMAIKKAEIPIDGNYHGRSTDDLNDFIKSGWDSAEVELDGRTTSNVRNALKMAIVRRGITDVKAITRRGKVYLVKVAE